MIKFKKYLDEDDEWKIKRVRIYSQKHNYVSSYAKYRAKIAKACINFATSKQYIFYHNSREEQKYEAKYTFKEFQKWNEYSCSASQANLKFQELYDEAYDNYFARTKQKIQTKNLRISAVVNINENHSLQDLQRLADKIEQKYGIQPIQIAIHRDEGHYLKDIDGEYLKDENGDFIFDPNLHAHIEFFTLDKQGINRYKSKDRYKMFKELQTLVANELGMERGKDYASLKEKPPQHLNRQEYAKNKAIAEKKALKEQRQAQENGYLKVELAKLRDVNELNKELREQLKQSGANRADYAKLEQEVNSYRQRIRNKELITKDELDEFKRDYSKKLDEKTAKIAELELENQTIKEKNQTLHSQNLELNSSLAKMQDEFNIAKEKVLKRFSKEIQDKIFIARLRYDSHYYILTQDEKNEFLEISKRCKTSYIEKLDPSIFSEFQKNSLKSSLGDLQESDFNKRYDKNEFTIYKRKMEVETIEEIVNSLTKYSAEKLQIVVENRAKEFIDKKAIQAQKYLELKKCWYGVDDSEEKELTPNQLENFFRAYYEKENALEKIVNLQQQNKNYTLGR